MRQRICALALSVGVLAAAGSAAAAAVTGVRVSVSPASGRPTTKFAVHFRAPSTTGGVALAQHYQVYAATRQSRRCTSSVSVRVGPTRQGQDVGLTLRPAGARGVWCAGRFSGRIVETVQMTCGPPVVSIACPNIEIAPITIARFSFRVRSAASSA